MVIVESSMYVPKMRAADVIDFMLHPTDEMYQTWWPGTHFSMHALNNRSGIGQVVYIDELVGDRRIRMKCIVTDLAPNRIAWRFVKVVGLPCWLVIQIDDDDGGARITHIIKAGYAGRFGRLLDPLFRVYFSARFARMMNEHFTVEFTALPEMLERLKVGKATPQGPATV